jgi:ABC-2 type transport system permease protein
MASKLRHYRQDLVDGRRGAIRLRVFAHHRRSGRARRSDLGSIPLFLVGAALNIFATTSLGIFLGTVAHSMQQFGIIVILVLLPLQILSGSLTPEDSMPEVIQRIMLLAPTTHFVKFAQGILYRGAGVEIVWPEFLYLLAIGATLFAASAWYFRRAMMKTG